MTDTNSTDFLRRIDAKLGALLALAIDERLSSAGLPRRTRPRAIDKLLADVGLPTREIAAILGKTERAVNLVLSEARKPKTAPRKMREVTSSSEEAGDFNG